MQLFESPDVIVLHSYLWGWMNSKVYKRKLDSGDEFLARVLGAAACVNGGEDQLRRTTRGLHTRIAKCIELDSGIFENLLWTVINLSFLWDKYVF